MTLINAGTLAFIFDVCVCGGGGGGAASLCVIQKNKLNNNPVCFYIVSNQQMPPSSHTPTPPPTALGKERKQMIYLTTHSTHFTYGYITSDI